MTTAAQAAKQIIKMEDDCLSLFQRGLVRLESLAEHYGAKLSIYINPDLTDAYTKSTAFEVYVEPMDYAARYFCMEVQEDKDRTITLFLDGKRMTENGFFGHYETYMEKTPKI